MRRLLVVFIGLLLVAAPAQARPAHSLSSSLPGEHPLYGYHADSLATPCTAWQGVQHYRNYNRPWLKVYCSGRYMSVRIRNFTFRDYTMGEKFLGCYHTCTRTGTVVRMVGKWRERYYDHAYGASAWVEVVQLPGGSTGGENVASYVVNGAGEVVGGPPT